MKRLLAILLGIALLTFALTAGVLASPGTTIYVDKAAWEAEVQNWQTEDFEDDTLNPGLSVVSDAGSIGGGLWNDQLFDPSQTTTWTFDEPIRAFGGNWDCGPAGPGASIAVSINGSWVYVGEIPNSYTGEFWGFVSDEEFTQVLLEAGSGFGTETYTLDDMVYGDLAVGGTVSAVNLSALDVAPSQLSDGGSNNAWLALWAGLAFVLAIGGGLLALRHRRAH